MEYADGGDLQNYLKKNFNNLSWDNKIDLAFQIAKGLSYLHNENILHKDLVSIVFLFILFNNFIDINIFFLKKNILIQHSKNIVIHKNNAKITDFGISKIEANSSIRIEHFGRIAYMEPQILVNPNFPYKKPSDIYSYGVLMWEISSGYPPFKDKFNNDNAIRNAIVYHKAREDTISNTPKDYEVLYKKCWNQEPEQRPVIEKILKEFSKMNFKTSIDLNTETIDDCNEDSIIETIENYNNPISDPQNVINFLEN